MHNEMPLKKLDNNARKKGGKIASAVSRCYLKIKAQLQCQQQQKPHRGNGFSRLLLLFLQSELFFVFFFLFFVNSNFIACINKMRTSGQKKNGSNNATSTSTCTELRTDFQVYKVMQHGHVQHHFV